MTDYVPLLAVLVFTAGQFGFWAWFVLRMARETRARELDYLRMIKDLQNRLTAKDIQGYLTLHGQDTPSSTGFGSRDDEAMARIAKERAGL